MELRHVAARTGRLASFLKGELKMSTGLMNRLKWGENLIVNGQPQWTNYMVQPGDQIRVRMEEPKMDYPAEEGALSVLYEDDAILAVDKPAGMLIHPSPGQNHGTLANLVKGYYEKTGQESAFHPLTRLDRDTFGIVLLAKNAYVHALLQDTRVTKTYHAIVLGGPTEDAGVIEAPIARKSLPSLLREIREDGKPSRTEFSVLWRENGMAKLALMPVTGRTHQLRLHCAHMGCPILGDPQYATEESKARSRVLGLQHQLLCAARLHFTHPITGQTMEICSRMDANV